MSIEVSTMDNVRRIDEELGVDATALKAFEDKFFDFMNRNIKIVMNSENGVSSADVYDDVKENFTGAELELFISQITSQAIISVIEAQMAQRNPLVNLLEAIASGSDVCGGSCDDCDCDPDTMTGEGGMA
tara:strand:+ start:2488 stop:2877 length:390 start_codon:yes stop_codon:yes gene_type:complete